MPIPAAAGGLHQGSFCRTRDILFLNASLPAGEIRLRLRTLMTCSLF